MKLWPVLAALGCGWAGGASAQVGTICHDSGPFTYCDRYGGRSHRSEPAPTGPSFRGGWQVTQELWDSVHAADARNVAEAQAARVEGSGEDSYLLRLRLDVAAGKCAQAGKAALERKDADAAEWIARSCKTR